jgi:ABC-type antimicrobial peptide transport system permease subunit
MLYLRALPTMLRHGLKASEIATALNAYPKPGVTGDQLASNIDRANIPGVKVVSPTDAKKALQQVSAIFNLIVMGSAIIALVVGALSVINTMAMAVAERVKEIGLKKAIGAKTTQVLRDFLTEALLMGFLGGLIGLGLGSLLVNVINSATASTGNEVFAVTTRLAVGTVVFATFLGAAAGLLPALRAARLNPVDALRSE